jgi:hypothetical protein
VADIRLSAEMVAYPLVDEYDVWVNKQTDERYYIHTISNKIEIRTVPVVLSVEMRPAAYSDVIYTIPIPDQIASKN